MSFRFLPVVGFCLAAFGPFARADVAISGVKNMLEDNVRAHLGLLELSCESPAWLVRWQFREVESDVAEGLEALGYYDSKVEKKLEFPEDACWQARIAIMPGEPVRIDIVEIRVDGPLSEEPAMNREIEAARQLQGQPLVHDQYESAKRKLLDVGRGIGYLDARLTRNEVTVKADAGTAAIHIDIDSGPRYRFGAISINQGVLDQRLIDAYLPFKEGDFYSVELLTRLRRNLNDSGYFAQAVVTAEADGSADKTVPVRIDLTAPDRRWMYTIGLGYATDTGPRLRADAEHRLLNRKGHRVAVRSLLSQVKSTLDTEYRIPHRDPLNDWFSFDAGAAREKTDTSESDILKIGARHSYLRWGWIESDFVELSTEDFEIADERNEARLLLFGSTLSRVWRDDPVRPTRGLRLNATVRGAHEAVISDTSFVQLRLGSKFVRGLSDSTRVLLRAEGGWTWKDEFSDLPPSVRFFAGGDTSIRGYEYQSVGPESAEGEVIGGSGLATGSVEFDWAFRQGWSAAAFVDTGSAFDREPEFFTGVGLGLRWYSPLGPVRVDLAHPLDDDGSPVRVHVTIGPDL